MTHWNRGRMQWTVLRGFKLESCFGSSTEDSLR
jgi:hypothetical protein